MQEMALENLSFWINHRWNDWSLEEFIINLSHCNVHLLFKTFQHLKFRFGRRQSQIKHILLQNLEKYAKVLANSQPPCLASLWHVLMLESFFLRTLSAILAFGSKNYIVWENKKYWSKKTFSVSKTTTSTMQSPHK